jgi:hypothetical protein
MATADCAAIVALMRSTASRGCDQIACQVIGQWLARRRRRDIGGLAGFWRFTRASGTDRSSRIQLVVHVSLSVRFHYVLERGPIWAAG